MTSNEVQRTAMVAGVSHMGNVGSFGCEGHERSLGGNTVMRKTVSEMTLALVAGLLVWCESAVAQTQINLIENPTFEAADDKGLPADWHLESHCPE